MKPILGPSLLFALGVQCARWDVVAQTPAAAAAGGVIMLLAWQDLAQGADNFMYKQDYVYSRSQCAV